MLLSRVVLSCTDMLCPPRSEGARCGTSAAEQHRRGGDPSLPRPTVRRRRRVPGAYCVTHVDFRLVKLRLPGRRDAAETTTRPDRPTSPQQLVSAPPARAGPRPSATRPRAAAPGRRRLRPPRARRPTSGCAQQQAAGRAEARAGAARGDDSLPARPRPRPGAQAGARRRRLPAQRRQLLPRHRRRRADRHGRPEPRASKNYASLLLFGFFLVMIVDSVVLSRQDQAEGRRAVPEGATPSAAASPGTASAARR